MKKTKIVCTLGPSSDSFSELLKLVQAGMNVARLNFSHGTHQHHLKIIKNLRKVERKTGKRIAIMQDLQGPKIRTGKMPPEGIVILQGDKVILTTRKIIGKSSGKEALIPVQYAGLPKDVKPGNNILIDDGLIKIAATKVTKTEIHCKVKHGGVIKTYKGLSVPAASISAKTITKKDKEDLKFGLKHKVDYVALSFVKDAKDIQDLRKLMGKSRKQPKIIAKIERREGVENLLEIVQETDGLMVARGDLGVNMPPEQVPLIQKRIIHLANHYGKPVITATQVLHSMIESPVATRAEISDAANSIFDHTDAIMLSNETSVGKFPARATRTLTKVSEAVEEELEKHEDLFGRTLHNNYRNSDNATCLNACELAVDMQVDLFVVYTNDGYTARNIVKHRIHTPIITITPNDHIARELTLLWGLNDIYVAKIPTRNTDQILKFLKKKKIVKKGNKVVILCNASKKENLISTLKI